MENIAAYILDGVLALALGALLRFGVPYIKSMLITKKFDFIAGWIDKGVAAAEQTIQGSKLGGKKKAFVIALLDKLGIVVDDAVDALIEAAVKKMNDAVDAAAAAVVKAAATAANDGAMADVIAADSSTAVSA